MDKQIKKMCYIYIYIYIYICTFSHKKDRNTPLETTWMNPEDIMLSEISQDILKDNAA